jgi:hypothetical protein
MNTKSKIIAVMMLPFYMVSYLQAAQYRVVELPIANAGEHSFPTAINGSGTVAVNLESQYSPYIDLSLIDFESVTMINYLTNIEAAKGGDLNDADYAFLYSYLLANNENQSFQQIASFTSYLADESSSELLHGFDSIDNLTGAYRNSATTMVRGINDFGYAVGVSQDGFYTLSYTTAEVVDLTYVLNDFYARGFALIDGKTVELLPPDITAGGLSDAFDINANNQVVGTGTIDVTSTFKTSADTCANDEERGDIPVASCLRALSISLNTNASSVAQRRGIIWQLDEKGNITDTLVLGMLITPSNSDTNNYSSTAVAINDYGVAVGESPAQYLNTSSLTTAAAFYKNDQVFTINQDNDLYASVATDINNDNLAVGYVTKNVNGLTKTKFFVHDIDADLTSYPEDFFTSSASVANAINNQAMVVGYAEAEATSGARRTEGFIYDYRNDLFAGLNSLIVCNSPYDIVQANAINDDNEIAATALITGPAKDINGDFIYDQLGAQTETDYVVAVKLIPIAGGSVDNCNATEQNLERQGASLNYSVLLILIALSLRIKSTRQRLF